ncbi:MAG: hypothetical protein ABEH38_08920 [Flavobacteriales bacterium]
MEREDDTRLNELIAMIRKREEDRPDLIEVLIDILRDDAEFELLRKSGKGGSRPSFHEPAEDYGSMLTEEQKQILEERRERSLRGEGRSYTWEELQAFFRDGSL